MKIKAVFKGLSTGLHGFHIHQFGNLIEGCKTAGNLRKHIKYLNN